MIAASAEVTLTPTSVALHGLLDSAELVVENGIAEIAAALEISQNVFAAKTPAIDLHRTRPTLALTQYLPRRTPILRLRQQSRSGGTRR
jgi:hypothetical protein